ncbi:pectinesterase [Ricinus communis]|uniref:Pectinesterase n=1 Tax=Ricinus communis TaxID=3988 RepID=B9RFE1_RICCO|nr:pectinesterase [Ricinus communis]EEF49912.1 Pectinesterase-2 precursor, putative [Ricinus communis]
MAAKLSLLSTISLLFMLFFSLSLAISLPIFKTPETLCNSTPYPIFCKSSLPYNQPGTIHDYAKISISQSLTNSRKFLSLVQYYLRLPSTSYQSTIRALEDCQLLAQLNIESLSYALENINSDDDLQSLLTSDLLTLFSATLTNQETCLEGLQSLASASSVLNDLSGHLSNGSKHYSTSLALFSHGWIPKTIKGRFLTERKQIFSSFRAGARKSFPIGRKLLEEFTNGVFVGQIVVVNPYGGGDFTTINGAVAAAPNNTAISDGYFAIYVVAGVYNEYVSIAKNKKYLMMIGDGINQTVITGNRNNVDGWTTFNSATFAVVGQGFVAVNITFQNTAGAVKHQAVAVRNGADLSAFYNCSFEGYQDTLYTHSLRQFYRDCEIYGTIDFIFGNAAVVFQNCKIYSRLPLSNQFNTITAQGRTDPNQNTGTSIQNCSIIAAEDLASSNGTTKTYLGRPWKEYSRTVVMQSFIDSLIGPAGWAPWSGDFALATLHYAEFDNHGPGSDISNRVIWPGYDRDFNATDADSFTVSKFIQGDAWLPTSGVPYFGGLQ